MSTAQTRKGKDTQDEGLTRESEESEIGDMAAAPIQKAESHEGMGSESLK